MLVTSFVWGTLNALLSYRCRCKNLNVRLKITSNVKRIESQLKKILTLYGFRTTIWAVKEWRRLSGGYARASSMPLTLKFNGKGVKLKELSLNPTKREWKGSPWAAPSKSIWWMSMYLLQNIQPTRVFLTKSKSKLQQFLHLLSRWGDTLKRLKKMALPSNTLWGWPTQDLKCFKCLLPKHDAWFQEHGSGMGDLLLDRNFELRILLLPPKPFMPFSSYATTYPQKTQNSTPTKTYHNFPAKHNHSKAVLMKKDYWSILIEHSKTGREAK